MRIRSLAATTLLAAGFSPLVQADPIAGFIDLYYMPYSQLKTQVPNGDGTSTTEKTDGDGYGAKGLLRVTDRVALDGEYQTSNYDGSAGIDTYRAGAGYYWRYFGLAADYINERVDDGVEKTKVDGVGLYVRTSWLATDKLAFTGSVGYLRLGGDGNSFGGFEYNAGLDFRMYGGLGAFADYRYSTVKDDGIHVKLGDARVGLRYVF